jgi:exosortase A-associated hydrolase 1
VNEKPLVFSCGEDDLVGVVAVPQQPESRGVLIVVGGPQYRAGSHRQFTLLARQLADAGIASLRFDYRGMGDSSGAARTFERSGEDIRSAIDQFVRAVPALQEVVIWGLCDAASAGLFYAHTDARVAGLVLLNPWVRTEQGLARAELRHYYGARIFQAGFWQKLVRGEVEVGTALSSFFARVRGALADSQSAQAKPLPERMEDGLRQFKGRVLLILSGDDLTAQEFKDLVKRSPDWQTLLQDRRVTRRELGEANHTFARREWRHQVATWSVEWLKGQR